MYTDTRTSTYAFFVYILSFAGLNFLYRFKELKYYIPVLKMIIVITLFIPIILSFLSPFLLTHFQAADVLTSMRLSVFTGYITKNTIINLLFGGSFIGDVDNGFLVMVYSAGLGFGLLTVYMISRAAFILIEQKNSKHLAFIISFMYFNLFESLMVRPELIISIYFWVVIYKTISLYPNRQIPRSKVK